MLIESFEDIDFTRVRMLMFGQREITVLIKGSRQQKVFRYLSRDEMDQAIEAWAQKASMLEIRPSRRKHPYMSPSPDAK